MAGSHDADILAVGMTTPVGLSAPATTAAIRAGISRIRDSTVHLGTWDGQRMGLLEERHLHPIAPALEPRLQGCSDRHYRLLRLSTLAFRELFVTWKPPKPPPLMLALPEAPGSGPDPIGPRFLEHLAQQVGGGFEPSQSRLFRQGRAGGLFALKAAQELLAARQVDCVYVGGVDSYLDLGLLARLDSEKRLLAEGRSDGFLPGEGAAFLMLTSPRRAQSLGLEPCATLLQVGTGQEPGHLYSDRPHLSQGLTDSFRATFAGLPHTVPPVRSVFAGFNGERFWGKEWGVASIRHRDHLHEEHRVDHPAEFIGDPGAALGPLMTGVAALLLKSGSRQGPCLIWCGSDREARAAALLHSAEE